MKIGIFDSGLGGLIITHALKESLGRYDYLYFGDTANLPYGNKTKDQIYEYTKKALGYLFENDCKLVIVACNSASADALRRIQQDFIPNNWPDRKALGVLIPSAEVAVRSGKKIGIICTAATAESGAFDREITKLSKNAELVSKATPELVEHIENGDMDRAHGQLEKYLDGMIDQGIDTLVLGCTHYPVIKTKARELMGEAVNVVSQDEIIAEKLIDYLARHSEIEKHLGKAKSMRFVVTKKTAQGEVFATKLFGEAIKLNLVKL